MVQQNSYAMLSQALLQDEAELSNEAGEGEGTVGIDAVHVLQDALLLLLGAPGCRRSRGAASHVFAQDFLRNFLVSVSSDHRPAKWNILKLRFSSTRRLAEAAHVGVGGDRLILGDLIAHLHSAENGKTTGSVKWWYSYNRIFMDIYIYIYMYRERVRERDLNMFIYVYTICLYIW